MTDVYDPNNPGDWDAYSESQRQVDAVRQQLAEERKRAKEAALDRDYVAQDAMNYATSIFYNPLYRIPRKITFSFDITEPAKRARLAYERDVANGITPYKAAKAAHGALWEWIVKSQNAGLEGLKWNPMPAIDFPAVPVFPFTAFEDGHPQWR